MNLSFHTLALEWALHFGGKGIYFAKSMGTIEYYIEQMKDSFKSLYVYEVKLNGNIKDESEVGELFYDVVEANGEDEASSIMVNEHGIDGIEYYTMEDGNSVVVFNDSIIEILSIKDVFNEI